ncbi:MAG TPA: DUF2378 family protein [Polyangiaceae bacterium]|nr:DUF2378 family protein [Polyangiaceae bacterium]
MAASPAHSARSSVEQLDAELRAHRLSPDDFVELDLKAALDVESRIAAAPEVATVRGMFFDQLVRSAKHANIAREERYVPFRNYPLRDYMRLVVDVARARFPQLALRDAMRRVGWDAFLTLKASVTGKVLFSFARGDAQSVLQLAPDAYKHTMSHCSVSLRVSSPGQVVLEYRDVYNFVECYQVGIVEGACRACGSVPQVRVRQRSAHHLDMLVRW